MRLGDAAVHVPAAEVQRDEADAGLAQPAGQQHLLAQARCRTCRACAALRG